MKLFIRFNTFIHVLANILSIHYSSCTKIGIVHFNDVNGQLQRYYPDTFNESSPPLANCKGEDYTTTCIGGLENIRHIASQGFPNDVPRDRIFTFSAGNFVGGDNGWLSMIGYLRFGKFAEKYISTPTIGINEFGSGVKETKEFNFGGPKDPQSSKRCVLSNIICPPPSSATEFEYHICWHTIPIQTLTDDIALLGFINPNATKLSHTGSLQFADIVTSLRKVVTTNSDNYQTFIAIGDGSFEIAQNILDSIPEIKLVIYSQGYGDRKKLSGEYPYQHGRNRYIATAGKYGSTVGRLILDIDEEGEIANTTGSTLVVPLGSEMNIHEIGQLNNMVETANIPVGTTLISLTGGDTCWRGECRLGNLVADSMVHCALHSSVAKPKTSPILSLLPSANLYHHSVVGGNNITAVDVVKWFRNRNPVHLMKIKGTHLLQVFQAGAFGLTANTRSGVVDWGQFLQVSRGFEVYYNTDGVSPVVEKVRIADNEDSMTVMKDLQHDKEYFVIIPSSIKEGRNVYEFATKFWKPHGNRYTETTIGLDSDCAQNYMRAIGGLQFGFEQRIWINNKDTGSGSVCLTFTVNATLSIIVTLISRLVHF